MAYSYRTATKKIPPKFRGTFSGGYVKTTGGGTSTGGGGGGAGVGSTAETTTAAVTTPVMAETPVPDVNQPLVPTKTPSNLFYSGGTKTPGTAAQALAAIKASVFASGDKGLTRKEAENIVRAKTSEEDIKKYGTFISSGQSKYYTTQQTEVGTGKPIGTPSKTLISGRPLATSFFGIEKVTPAPPPAPRSIVERPLPVTKILPYETLFKSPSGKLPVAGYMPKDINIGGISPTGYTVIRESGTATPLTGVFEERGVIPGRITQIRTPMIKYEGAAGFGVGSDYSLAIESRGALAGSQNLKITQPSGYSAVGEPSLVSKSMEAGWLQNPENLIPEYRGYLEKGGKKVEDVFTTFDVPEKALFPKTSTGRASFPDPVLSGFYAGIPLEFWSQELRLKREATKKAGITQTEDFSWLTSEVVLPWTKGALTIPGEVAPVFTSGFGLTPTGKGRETGSPPSGVLSPAGESFFGAMTPKESTRSASFAAGAKGLTTLESIFWLGGAMREASAFTYEQLAKLPGQKFVNPEQVYEGFMVINKETGKQQFVPIDFSTAKTMPELVEQFKAGSIVVREGGKVEIPDTEIANYLSSQAKLTKGVWDFSTTKDTGFQVLTSGQQPIRGYSAGAGQSVEQGIYVSPLYRSSPYFLGTSPTGQYDYSFSLFPQFPRPSTSIFEIGRIERVPRDVLKGGVKSVNEYYASRAGSSTAFVSIRAEKALASRGGTPFMGSSPAYRAMKGSSESALVIPKGEPIFQRTYGTFTQDLLGWKYYTRDPYTGSVVPLREYTLTEPVTSVTGTSKGSLDILRGGTDVSEAFIAQRGRWEAVARGRRDVSTTYLSPVSLSSASGGGFPSVSVVPSGFEGYSKSLKSLSSSSSSRFSVFDSSQSYYYRFQYPSSGKSSKSGSGGGSSGGRSRGGSSSDGSYSFSPYSPGSSTPTTPYSGGSSGGSSYSPPSFTSTPKVGGFPALWFADEGKKPVPTKGARRRYGYTPSWAEVAKTFTFGGRIKNTPGLRGKNIFTGVEIRGLR